MANALGGFLDGMLTGINNMATALSSANISGQVDAIVASLGAGQGPIGWRDMGLELAGTRAGVH